MFQGFISKFTKNNLVKTAAAACIAASVAFGQTQFGTSGVYWELTGTAPNRTLTISGTGDMPTNFTYQGANNPWWSSRTNITTVIIQDGVTTIGNNSFYNHTGLTSVTIPNSVTSIGDQAFSLCTKLTSVTIPNSVTSIGTSAFSGCTGLTSVEIPNSVTSIGNGAFYGCTGLTSVTIPNSVTSIGNYAFQGCKGLTSVTIPNSVTSIGQETFRDCSGLTSVTIGSGVTSIGSNAFQDCSGLTTIIVDENNTFYASEGGVLYNKAKTQINTVPDKLSGALTIPNSLTTIGGQTFQNRTGLTSVTIGSGVTSIGNQAFRGCTGLTSSVEIPNSVKTIGNEAFRGCTGLTSMTIGNGVASIGQLAFYGCTGLTSVTIGNSVTSIGSNAFDGCTGLTSITIPNSVTSIGTSAFYGCTGLTSITIGSGLTSTANLYFGNVLTLINVAEENNSYSSTDGILFNKAKTELVKFPAGKTGAYTIPNSVASINVSAFANCKGLTSVNIPNSVTSIGNNAFQNCTGLKHIVNGAATPQAISNNSQFNEVTLADVNLFVPASAINDYKAANNWKDFKNVLSIETPKPTKIANLVYTGEEKTGTTEDVRYIVTNGKATNAGEHEAKIVLLDGLKWENDGTTGEITLKWTIAKADYDMLGVAMEDKAVTHDGQPHKIEISGTLPADVNVSYTGNGQTAEGRYTITATFTTSNSNYNAPAPMTAKLTINNKNTYDMSGITFANKTVNYDGQPHKIEINGTLPANVSVSYVGNGQTAIGKYPIEAVFATSDPTYNVPSKMVAELEIKAGGANPIKKPQKSDGRVGIRLSKNVVSDKAEFEVILPNDKVLEVKAVIYDNTGNVVFEKTERGASVSWNLTNISGRNVANGTYLIIVEAKGINGNYAYSAKVGVKK